MTTSCNVFLNYIGIFFILVASFYGLYLFITHFYMLFNDTTSIIKACMHISIFLSISPYPAALKPFNRDKKKFCCILRRRVLRQAPNFKATCRQKGMIIRSPYNMSLSLL